MQRQEVFVRSRPPDLIFRPLLAGSLFQKHYTTRCRRAVSQSLLQSRANSYPNWSLAWWDFVWAARGVLGYRRAGQRNGAGVSPTDWKFRKDVQEGGRAGGSTGGVCLKLHWIHLKTKNMSFFIIIVFFLFYFLQKHKTYKKKKGWISKLWKRWARSLCVHAALHASPRLSSVGAKKPFPEVLSGIRTLRPRQPVGEMALKGSHQVKRHKSRARLAFGTTS